MKKTYLAVSPTGEKDTFFKHYRRKKKTRKGIITKGVLFVLLWDLQYCCIFQKLTDVYVRNLNDTKTCREHNFECLIISHRLVTRNYPETYRNPEVQNP